MAWFAKTWTAQEARKVWPFLTNPAGTTLHCQLRGFSPVTQFALLQCTHAIAASRHLQVRVSTGTDNTATEAGMNKLFTTKWPLGHFLRLIASWGHARGINLRGDELNRGKLHRFQHRRHERFRFQPKHGRLTLHPDDTPWRPEHRHASCCKHTPFGKTWFLTRARYDASHSDAGAGPPHSTSGMLPMLN